MVCICCHSFHDKSASILDLGCGNGTLLLYLMSKGYQECFGVDFSEEQVALAHQRGLTKVVRGDLLTFLENHKRPLDCIIALDVFEHFKRDEVLSIVDLCFQRLNPGGRLIIHSPNAASPFFGCIRYGDLTHELAFTKRSIMQLFRAGGFGRIEVYPEGPRVHGLKSAIRCLLWFFISKVMALCLLAETGSADEILTQNLLAVAFRDSPEQ